MTPSIGFILAIALGGALGAVSRHYVGALVMSGLGTSFPAGTLAVNVAGSFLIGLLVTTLVWKMQVAPEMRAFLVVGFLGSFTTFSTFSLELLLLLERGETGQMIAYGMGSLLLGGGAAFAGMALGRGLI
ncbi:fluoride efflux transporter CrcB [Yunchengibacter salinarum]|uniref:fluoride efflux transporter CrcB n=1 Tax=Yunchengibacter salinarum TaxID=3133399 RepID=UPI0035B69076